MQSAVPAHATQVISAAPMRLHGLDTLRGLAAILVVLLHAGIPYMTCPLQYLVWPARDAHPSEVVDGITWCTECFLMPLFFVLAGFFSQGLLISRGEHAFLCGRTKRLLPTQLAAALAIMPVCLAIWTMGWVADGLYIPRDFMNTGILPELEAELYGVGHIWFLQNLYLYCVMMCGGSWLKKRYFETGLAKGEARRWQGFDRIMTSVWKPLLPSIPCALILYWDPRIVLGFYQGYMPAISKLAYYSVYFFVGAAMGRHRCSLYLHARYGTTYLLIAGMLFTAILPMIHEQVRSPLSGERLAVLTGLLSLFAWFATFGLIAIFLGPFRGSNVVTAYLAEASFWVYLIHLPFVGLTQIAVAQLEVPTVIKFLLTGTTATALALMTYHVFVRDRWLGEFLNGCCRAKKQVTDGLEPTTSQVLPSITGNRAA